MQIAKVIFWCCAAGLFYTYLGYPLHVLVWSRLFPRPVKKARYEGRVSVVISVFNDAVRLIPKLNSLFKANGSERICEILVGSDGSTDGIASAIANLNEPRIHLFEFPNRRGKASVLNDLIAKAAGDVVVMTDARQILKEDALDAMLAPFADASVGVVSGHLVFRKQENTGTGTEGVGSYWNYEKMIRRAEAAFGSVPGASGALYAIRRALLRTIPAATILDDVAIPMLAVEQGVRCVFADDAVCYDDVASTVAAEQRRKRRTIAGVIQLAALFPRLLIPWRNPIWWQYASHKFLRLFSPFFLIGLLAACAFLWHVRFFAWVLALQLLGYFLALAGWVAGRVGVRLWLLSNATVFAALNVTTLAAWSDALRGRFTVAWQKT